MDHRRHHPGVHHHSWKANSKWKSRNTTLITSISKYLLTFCSHTCAILNSYTHTIYLHIFFPKKRLVVLMYVPIYSSRHLTNQTSWNGPIISSHHILIFHHPFRNKYFDMKILPSGNFVKHHKDIGGLLIWVKFMLYA